jgi:hypothetical protein
MNDRDKRRYDSFKRERTFGKDNAADFAAASVAKANFAMIDEVIGGLDAAKAGQLGNANTSKETLLNAVRLDIQNITRTASAIEEDEPGFADKFSPPKAYNEAALMLTADAFLLLLAVQPADSVAVKTAKAALVAKFVAHEMNENFVTNLQADRDAITTLNSEMESDSEDRVGSTAVINPLIQKGMKASNVLDAIMHNKYSTQPDKLAAWLSASHIERDPKRTNAKPATAPAPATPK